MPGRERGPIFTRTADRTRTAGRRSQPACLQAYEPGAVPLKFAKNKAVAAAATLTTITALAVTSTQDEQEDRSIKAASASTPSEVRITDLADIARRDAALARASRSRSDAAATALRIRESSKAAAAQEAAAQAAQAAEAQKAAADEAERRAVAHQGEHDKAAQATRAAARTTLSRRLAATTSGTAPRAAAVRTSSGTSDAGRGALAEAPDHQGKPYEWGATGPDRFDCSGFTSYLFAQQGVQLPRTARDQYAASTKVSKDAKQPGDLIFTYGDNGIYHVGIYAGDGAMWAATKSGDVVRRQAIWTSQYYVGRFS